MRALQGVLAALCMASLPQVASAAENLDCVSSGYSAETQAVQDQFVAGFSLEEFDNPAPPEALDKVINDRAIECAAVHGWPVVAMDAASDYRMAQLAEMGIRRVAPQAGQVVDRVDTDLPPEERARIWRIISGITATDGAQEPTEDDFQFLGLRILALGGDGSDESNSAVGSILALVWIKRLSAEKFKNSQE